MQSNLSYRFTRKRSSSIKLLRTLLYHSGSVYCLPSYSTSYSLFKASLPYSTPYLSPLKIVVNHLILYRLILDLSYSRLIDILSSSYPFVQYFAGMSILLFSLSLFVILVLIVVPCSSGFGS
ncbi:hypothetical protein KEM48_010298 [Puccinia striiformis f. sp. tritici PST-130]|nr:hypothetical protein KEM48_010298 [Puccinia striiformis f. sp. tritici PST-130]